MIVTHCQDILKKMLTAVVARPSEIGRVNYTLNGIEAFFIYEGLQYHIQLTTSKGESE